ncbi:hypothetical protein E1A91_A06G044400v1 [Gossypium mustelinum]|uniref:Pentatricopeptide repeat-containing protein n=1 Tax=Gossypium mustelinum TaxID=34275 RepID=A0A5D2YTG2_GOSMU|nr:hypothetical protein E1A91_A06G044400v1 [Gossypium mustelinum]
MHAKCGDIVKARWVFDSIAYKDNISWNSMLTGYIRHRLLAGVLQVFPGMIQKGFEPDFVTISTILSSFSSLKTLDGASWLFQRMPERDIMVRSGTSPDSITFVVILSACAHLSLVKDGERLFWLMRKKYGIDPRIEHYACMVNLYGSAGLIDEAFNMIVERMEFEARPTAWGAMLYACSVHGNIQIGEIAGQKLFELEPDNQHNFELLMKIYSDARRAEDAERVRKLMLDRGL